jgi:predicted nucleotidyltransferase
MVTNKHLNYRLLKEHLDHYISQETRFLDHITTVSIIRPQRILKVALNRSKKRLKHLQKLKSIL